MAVGREAERTQAAVEAVRRRREANDKAKVDKTAAEAAPPSEAPEKPASKVAEPAPPKEPPKEAAKPAVDESTFRSQVERAQRAALENERRALESEAALKELRAKVDAFENMNPLDYLKAKNTSLEQMVRDAAAGKLRPTTELDLAMERSGSELAELRKTVEELREREQGREQQAQRERDAAFARQRLTERAEALPLASAMPWAADIARDRYHAARKQGQEVDFESVLSDLNAAIESDGRALLGNEQALKTLLSDGELRASVRRVIDAMEPKQQPKATPPRNDRGGASDGPSAIPREIVSQPGSRAPAIPTERERIAAAGAALRRLRG
jgi:hypothetical protein